jgi:hypothetical protein
MPDGVRVHVTNQTVISALNTPGGAVYEWRDKVMHDIQDRAVLRSPVNNPANARHRGGVVGTYRRGWRTSRAGSNGHRVRLTVSNVADHATFVEFGRSASSKFQVFSWTRWGGRIGWVGADTAANQERAGHYDRMGGATAARPGKHVLKNATNYVLHREGLAGV